MENTTPPPNVRNIVTLGKSPERRFSHNSMLTKNPLEKSLEPVTGEIESELTLPPKLPFKSSQFGNCLDQGKHSRETYSPALKEEIIAANGLSISPKTNAVEEELVTVAKPPEGWSLFEDEDEEAVDFKKPPEGWSLFGYDEEENEVDPSSHLQETPPRRRIGALEIPPERTKVPISTPQRGIDTTVISGSKLKTEDGLEIPYKSIHLAYGGCGEIERLVTDSASGIQNTGFVAKRFNDKSDPELNEELFRNLQQVNHSSIVVPLQKVGTTIFYEEQLCDLDKLKFRSLLDKADQKTGNKFIAHILYELIQKIGDFHQKIDAAHNDIKPANILIPQDSRTALRYADFGSISPTKSFKTAITPEFAAVEYVDQDADLELNYRADYYSIGLTILKICFDDNFYDLFTTSINHQNANDIKRHHTIWLERNEEFKTLLKSEHLEFYLKYKDALDIVIEYLNPNSQNRPKHSGLLKRLRKTFNLRDDAVHENIAQIFEEAKQNYLSTKA